MPPYNIETSVRNYFGFLLDDFGFSIKEERYNQEMRNAVVIFSKDQTCIELVKDRGQIFVSIGDQRLIRWDWVEFTQAIQFLSGNPDPVYSFPSQYNDVTEEAQLYRVSALLKQHCLVILSGEMSVVQLQDAIRLKSAKKTSEFLDSLKKNKKLNQSN
jgi:hypothetical protein